MNIIIQCAGTKTKDEDSFLKDFSRRRLRFVADPTKFVGEDVAYRPDDMIPNEARTWREWVGSLNAGNYPEGQRLFRAGDLYVPRNKPYIYQRLIEEFGWQRVFILSAGWGLVRADFRIPNYDITFSHAKNVPPYARRRVKDASWKDYCQLDMADRRPLVFFGTVKYISLLGKLTREYIGIKFAFYSADGSEFDLEKAGFKVKKFARFTNWHYECAEKWCSRETLQELVV